MGDMIGIAQYLLTRLQQLRLETVFGVPGDFQLILIDEILKSGLKWAGSANELVAAYAADGYARINGIGAVVTTFGPGELSAVNGIAGAYSEFVPVVHIVGYPNRRVQQAGMILHHTLGDGKYGMFHEMSKHISCATTVLNDEKTAIDEIDRVLQAMLFHSRPVYIGIPMDMVHLKVPVSCPLSPLPAILDPSDENDESALADLMINRIQSSSQFALIVDIGAARFGLLNEVSKLIDVVSSPHFVTAMARTCIDETHSCFGGLYGGELSDRNAKEYVEAADCVLKIGNYPSDLNTGAFTERYKTGALIDCQQRSTKAEGKTFNANTRKVLSRVLEFFESAQRPASPRWQVPSPAGVVAPSPSTGKITFDWLLHRMSQFFRNGDLVVVETGSVSIGMTQVSFPKGVHAFTQTVWGSIGFATGSAVGAFTAALEQSERFKRPILITGEGSMQMTVQALGDMLRFNLAPIIFVLNNDGYTCERVVNGRDQPYNDVATWNWQTMLESFGPDFMTRSYKAETLADLDELLDVLSAGEFKGAQLVEVRLDKYDVPSSMTELAAKLRKPRK